MPLSVIMTCHNEARFIRQAIESVVAQTCYDDIAEIIVVNDGSTDDSAQILAGLQAGINKMRVIERPGIGLPAARNCAIAASRGELIAFLDGDDFWLPEKTALQLPAFSSSAVGLVYSDYVDFSAPDVSDGQLICVRRYAAENSDTLSQYFLEDGPIMPSTTIIRRAVFDEVGLFDENLRIGEDAEMFLRIAERWRFQHVPGGLLFKRRHANAITRRLDTLLPVMTAVTRRFADRNARLAPLAQKRMSRRYARIGNDCAQHGEFRQSMRYFLAALRNDPFFWRTYMYIILAFIPVAFSQEIRRRLKAVFHHLRRQAA